MTNKEIKDNLRSFNFNDQQILQLINVIKGIVDNQTKDQLNTLNYKVKNLDDYNHVPINDRIDAKPDDILIQDVTGNLMWLPKNYFDNGYDEYIKLMYNTYSYGVMLISNGDKSYQFNGVIGNTELYNKLPIQNSLKGVTFNIYYTATGTYKATIKNYLNPDDWTLPMDNGEICNFTKEHVGVALEQEFYIQVKEEIIDEIFKRIFIYISNYNITGDWLKITPYIYGSNIESEIPIRTYTEEFCKITNKPIANNIIFNKENNLYTYPYCFIDSLHYYALQILGLIEYKGINFGTFNYTDKNFTDNIWKLYNNKENGIINSNIALTHKVGNKNKNILYNVIVDGKTYQIGITYFHGISIVNTLSYPILDLYIKEDETNKNIVSIYKLKKKIDYNVTIENIETTCDKIGECQNKAGFIKEFVNSIQYPLFPSNANNDFDEEFDFTNQKLIVNTKPDDNDIKNVVMGASIQQGVNRGMLCTNISLKYNSKSANVGAWLGFDLIK